MQIGISGLRKLHRRLFPVESVYRNRLLCYNFQLVYMIGKQVVYAKQGIRLHGGNGT